MNSPGIRQLMDSLDELEVTETLNYDYLSDTGYQEQQTVNGIDYQVKVISDGPEWYDNVVEITASHDGNPIGEATFKVTRDQRNLYSLDTWVWIKYRGQGIATQMYTMAKKFGDIVPSHALSDAGARLHQSLRRKKILPES